MPKQSAGILVYRKKNDTVEVFLVHPGGPFWKNKDDYAWSIPKGMYEENEDAFNAAKREFTEETGQTAPEGEYSELGTVKLASGKEVAAWAVESDLGNVQIKSNTFSLEWPPKSGKQQEFPEVDRARWFDLSAATRKIHPGLNDLLRRLAETLKVTFSDQSTGSLEDKLNDTQISLL
ncbi:MAG TPA: NUDIX domain-containing protein [Candidatus Saccharimonadales bacterium]|nr:NUDIX domain-containing protein [Candidatus Saccharimonadales bacterium]